MQLTDWQQWQLRFITFNSYIKHYLILSLWHKICHHEKLTTQQVHTTDKSTATNNRLLQKHDGSQTAGWQRLPHLTLFGRVHRRIWRTSEHRCKFVRIWNRPDDAKPRQAVRIAQDGIAAVLHTTVSAPDLQLQINSNAVFTQWKVYPEMKLTYSSVCCYLLLLPREHIPKYTFRSFGCDI